jgi:hypothetical protein
MKNVKVRRWLIAVLIGVMMISSFSLIFAANGVSDLKGHWAESQLNSWIDKGLIQGYKDGTIKPNNPITRAEFMALVNRAFKFTEKSDVSFSDVNPKDWTYDEVAKAIKAGYIKGYSDGTIGIGKQVTRQEVAVIIGRLLKLETGDNKDATDFADAADFAKWGKDFIDAVVANKIMNGYSTDHTFKPNKPITRAEAVVTLDNAIQAMANMSLTTEEGATTSPVPEPTDMSGATDTPPPAGGVPSETPSGIPSATPAVTPTPTPTPKPTPKPLKEDTDIIDQINPNKATPTPTPSARQTPKPNLISTPKPIPTIPPKKF